MYGKLKLRLPPLSKQLQIKVFPDYFVGLLKDGSFKSGCVNKHFLKHAAL